MEKEEILRMTVSKQGERALVDVMEKVNENFNGGKVSKVQLINWILKRFKDDLDESMVREIRADHFDEVAVLESLLRKVKETGKVPPEFKQLLQREIGLDGSGRKKSKVALTEVSTNDGI